MRERGRIGFPVLAVELVDDHIQIHPIVEATPRHRKPVLIGAGDVEAFHPTGLAKAMFRPACIEGVLAEMIGAFYEPKSRCGDDHVNVAAHRADGAIAILHFKHVGKVDFKTHRLAVATASMGFQLFHDAAITPVSPCSNLDRKCLTILKF